jgi:hypothetical protein
MVTIWAWIIESLWYLYSLQTILVIVCRYKKDYLSCCFSRRGRKQVKIANTVCASSCPAQCGPTNPSSFSSSCPPVLLSFCSFLSIRESRHHMAASFVSSLGGKGMSSEIGRLFLVGVVGARFVAGIGVVVRSGLGAGSETARGHVLIALGLLAARRRISDYLDTDGFIKSEAVNYLRRLNARGIRLGHGRARSHCDSLRLQFLLVCCGWKWLCWWCL